MRIKPVIGDWEVPRIEHMSTDEHRRFAELQIPGRAGSLLQDLNAAPTAIVIAGSLHEEEERSAFLENVRQKFREGAPLTFVADITQATDIQYVVIESMEFEESGTRPDEIRYRLTLKESPPPPPPLPDPLGALDDGLFDLAEGFVDAVTGALDAIDALSNIPDFSDPSALLGGALEGVTDAIGDLDDVGSAIDDLFGGD